MAAHRSQRVPCYLVPHERSRRMVPPDSPSSGYGHLEHGERTIPRTRPEQPPDPVLTNSTTQHGPLHLVNTLTTTTSTTTTSTTNHTQ